MCPLTPLVSSTAATSPLTVTSPLTWVSGAASGFGATFLAVGEAFLLVRSVGFGPLLDTGRLAGELAAGRVGALLGLDAVARAPAMREATGAAGVAPVKKWNKN